MSARGGSRTGQKRKTRLSQAASYLCTGVAAVLGVLILWAAVSTLLEVNVLYGQQLELHQGLFARAADHLADPNGLCVPENAHRRVRSGEQFAGCLDAERVVRRWPRLEAFYGTMRQIEFCPWGSCLEFQVGLFGMINLLAGAAVFGSVFAVLAIGLWLGSIAYSAWQNSGGGLPVHVSHLHAASYAKQAAYCHNEHVSDEDKVE